MNNVSVPPMRGESRAPSYAWVDVPYDSVRHAT